MSLNPKKRKQIFQELFPNEPAFRLRQLSKSLFHPNIRSWNDVSTLTKDMRSQLQETPFVSLKTEEVFESKNQETFKAILTTANGDQIEAVLMKNRRGHWTICVSSQIGCAMACDFCATGKMGLTRSLTSDEIVDQYRVWLYFLADRPDLTGTITNIVYMGMGEPLANYTEVRESLNTILEETEIGKTRITVSTVGVIPRLKQILTDKEWPHIRLAVSLHSADADTRKSFMPTSYEKFLPDLAEWGREYLKVFSNRRHHLTFEYIMLRNINDTEIHAKKLAKYVNSIGNVRVNLIPYNFTSGVFVASEEKKLDEFLTTLQSAGITATVRRSKGDDIEAACGQLVKEGKKNKVSK